MPASQPGVAERWTRVAVAGFRRAAVLLVVVVLAAGCGSTPPTPPAATGGDKATSPAPASPGVRQAYDPTPLRAVAVAGHASADQLGSQAAKLGEADRAQIAAAKAIGPGAADLQDAMDKADAGALQQLSAKLAVFAPPGSSSASTGTQDAVVELLAYRGSPAPVNPLPATVLLTLAFSTMVGMGITAMNAFDPRTDHPSSSTTVTQDSSSGSAAASVEGKITWGWAGGQLSVAIDLSGTGTRTDAATGAVSTMSGSTHYSVVLNPCPLPNGAVEGKVAVGDDESFTGGGKTVGYKYDGLSAFLTQVDPQAEIEFTSIDDDWSRSVTTVSDDGNTDTTTAISLSGSTDYDSSGHSTSSSNDWTAGATEGDPTTADYQALGGVIGTFGDGAALLFSSLARAVWRGGKCFEIRPQPNGGQVGSGSQTAVKVTVYHWVDKADIVVPVTATLAGAQKIDPTNTPKDAPATFTYTAGTPGTTGTVTYKVTSDRGIAEKTSTFTVRAGVSVDISGTLLETAGPVTYNLKIKATGIEIRVAVDGTISVSGAAKVTGPASAFICKGTINETVQVTGAGTVAGTPDAPVYHVRIGPASTNTLGGSFSCPGISVSGNRGDFFGQWSSTIGYVDYPAAGGTLSMSNTSTTGGLLTRNAHGSYTVTPLTH